MDFFAHIHLGNVVGKDAKKAFIYFVSEFVPLRGVMPLLLNCGHIICDECVKSFANKSCPICNIVSQCDDNQTLALPLNIYTLGLMVMSHNRLIKSDDVDISFSKSSASKPKQQGIKGLYRFED